MRRLLRLLPLLAVALVAAGCGAVGSGGGTKPSTTVETTQGAMGDEVPAAKETRKPPTTGTATGARIKVVDSEFGTVIADRTGEALYLFDRENRGKSECYGECAQAWPPVLTKGKPQAAAGARQNLLGTTKRADGKLQVTYAGQPLYYYVDDSPGVILCNDVEEFGGLWLVVDPSGAPYGA